MSLAMHRAQTGGLPLQFYPAYLLLEVISRIASPKQASRLMRAGLQVHRSYQSNHTAHRMLGFRTLVFAKLEQEAGPARDREAVADSGWRWAVQLLESTRLCLGEDDFASFIEAVNSILDATKAEREAVPA
ncbi:hypothetical protein AB0O22_05170 [Streptomyces sp. NPDC091204]|uniref:hypothetical protein n=1 Tax=Streptomyces sp. NPDC091204 TaxID=3155299 RepID=UPI00341951C0